MRQVHEPKRRFHIEHVIAKRHRGSDDSENLALACALCNVLKGADLTSLDPDTNELTRLFHPRRDRWAEHFRMDGPRIAGITDVGRTTVWLLDMNCEVRLGLRSLLIELGELD